MKSTRRPCPLCGLNGAHHPRGDTGRVVWCKATERTWPLAPLVAKAGGQRALCRLLGLPHKGLPAQLTDVQADHWALRCGWHPDHVWPDWSAAGLRYVDDVFVNGGGWRPAWLDEQPAATTAPTLSIAS